jgi:Ni/Co efflux regulator RcnB
MSDGREEREEQEQRRKWEKEKKDRDDDLDRDWERDGDRERRDSRAVVPYAEEYAYVATLDVSSYGH